MLHIAIFHPTRTDLVAAVQQIGQTLGFRVIDGKVQVPDLEAVYVKGFTLNEAKGGDPKTIPRTNQRHRGFYLL